MSVAVINDLNCFFERDGQFFHRELALGSITRLIDLVELGHKLNGRTIWVTPGCRLSRLALSDPTAFTQRDHLVDVRASKTSQGIPTFVLAWRREGSYQERNAIKIVFPEHDSRWPYQDCVIAMKLLKSITALEEALDCPVEWSPGHVGLDMIKDLNAKRPDWIRPSKFDPFVSSHLARDLTWKKPLQGKKWLHIFDKNSMYLAAATSTNLGAGDAAIWQSVEFNPKIPGLWEITLSSRPGVRFYPPGRQFLWTPEVEYLRNVTDDFVYGNAIVWPEYHQTLRSWGEKLWAARSELKRLREARAERYQSYNYAYNAVKCIATQGLGWLAHEPEHGESQFYRPDWWSMVVSSARAKMLWKVKQLEEKGLRVVWINVDALGIESDSDDPLEASLGHLSRVDNLGGWKMAQSMPITEEIMGLFSDEVKFLEARKGLLTIARRAA